jgi:hypothetical protein
VLPEHPTHEAIMVSRIGSQNRSWPGIVAHTYNPSYMEGGHGRIVVRGQPGQKVSQDAISKNKLGVVGHTCNHPSYL